MAKLTIMKHPNAVTSSVVSKEEYEAGMNQIQKRINRIEKIQKAKSWKHNLTK